MLEVVDTHGMRMGTVLERRYGGMMDRVVVGGGGGVGGFFFFFFKQKTAYEITV